MGGGISPVDCHDVLYTEPIHRPPPWGWIFGYVVRNLDNGVRARRDQLVVSIGVKVVLFRGDTS